MNVLDFKQLKKNIKKDRTGFKPVSLSILGNHATQFLAKGIEGYGVEGKLDIDIYEAEYDLIDIQVFNPDSELYAVASEFVVITKSAIRMLKKYYRCPLGEKPFFAQKIIEEYRSYIESINAKQQSKIIITNFIELPDMVFSNFGNKVEHSWTYQVRSLNFKLMELAAENKNVFISDTNAIHNRLGRQFSFDPQMYIRTDVTTNFDFQPHMAQGIVDIIKACIGKFKKCLILDLDHTTWGGIIGDDGMEGIQIGSLGLGKAFTELQLWAKNLKDRGIVLAICSKNTESVAKEPFEKHPDMVLRLDDIAVFVANWENKADNIRYIQNVLNIGFDSMVFLDDNPFERNLVRKEIPEVTVPELPPDPADYIPYLQQFNLFETASFSNLDKDRTKQYQTEAKRVNLQTSFKTVDDYLKNLGMTAIAKPFDKFQVPRIAQLTQRSNQFNLRTSRYSEKEIQDIMTSDDHMTFYTALKDKFGDYGLISLQVMEKRGTDSLFLDTWIMSCRVLKRDVEKFVLNELVLIAKKEGIKTLIGERIPTKKNILVVDHYKDLGFVEKDGLWYLDVESYKELEHYIAVNEPAEA